MVSKSYKIGEGYGSSSLYPSEDTIPSLSPREVLVQVKCVSLNYRDTLVVNGVWKPPTGRIPASDAAGEIVSVGRDVKSLKPGQRVATLFFPNWTSGRIDSDKLKDSLGGIGRDGVLQQYVVFAEHELIVIPDYLTYEKASTLPCAALAAWNGLVETGNIQSGNTVLIVGTGVVSLFSLQFALLKGADPIVLSSSDKKLDQIKILGVKKVINYRKYMNWESKVKELTNGRGVDHVVEVIGASHINRSIDVVAMGGTISVLGLMGGVRGELNTEAIMEKNIRLQGTVVGSKEMFFNLLKAMEENKIEPIVDRTFSFSETQEAFRYLEDGKFFGKVCIAIE